MSTRRERYLSNKFDYDCVLFVLFVVLVLTLSLAIQGVAEKLPNDLTVLSRVSADCLVVVSGIAVTSVVEAASFQLELFALDVCPVDVLYFRREVVLSFSDPRVSRQVALQLNTKEILSQRVTSATGTSQLGRSIIAQHAPQSAKAQRGSLGGDGTAERLASWQVFSNSAIRVHSMEVLSVNEQLLDLPTLHRPSFRASNLTKTFWLYGVLDSGDVFVFTSERAASTAANNGAAVKVLSCNGQTIWVVGQSVKGITDVYSEQSRDALTGVISLRWVVGENVPVDPTRPITLRNNGRVLGVSGEPTGSFVVRELREYRAADGTASLAPTVYQKLTHDWWVQGRDVTAVREVFELVSRGQNEVVLRDIACGHELKLDSTALYHRTGAKDTWVAVCQGTWGNSQQTTWDSCSTMSQEYEAHFQTRGDWQEGRWWVDGSGDFSLVHQLHKQLPTNDSTPADSVKLQSGLGQITTLCSGTSTTANPVSSFIGEWRYPPCSAWLPHQETDGEAQDRLALEAARNLLYAQEQEYAQTCLVVQEKLHQARDAATKDRLLNQLTRERYRLQARLPAYAHRKHLLNSVRNNQVTVLIGATGSGKSTQTLPFLVDSGVLSGGAGAVVCTQPRRVGALSLANYVAREWGCEVGQEVAVKCGGANKYDRHRSKMVYQTDQSLLHEIAKDRLLTKYEVC